VYVALACVEAISVALELSLGNGALAIRCAAFGLAWLLVGGVLLGTTRLNWPERSLTDMIPTRPLSKEDAHRLFPRWLLALLLTVQVAAMAFIAYSVFRPR
jgi:hypothetical protein